MFSDVFKCEMPVEYKYKGFKLGSFSVSPVFTELWARNICLGIIDILIFTIVILG